MRLPTLSAALVLTLSPAAAYADDCAPIAAAYAKLAEVPAYRQVIALAGGEGAETVAIGDTLYVKSGGEWQRMDLPPGGRRQTVMQFLDKDALKGCAVAGADTLNGAAMTKYGYEPPVMGGFPMSRQTLWIGDADGLPHRMASDDGSTTVDISYEGVVAPK